LPEHVGRTACIRTGHDVQVLDLSRGGALIEGRVRLVPDSAVELRFNGVARSQPLRARVVRCYVSALENGTVSYQAGVAFEEHLSQVEFEVRSNG
jgi:PilZ domain